MAQHYSDPYGGGGLAAPQPQLVHQYSDPSVNSQLGQSNYALPPQPSPDQFSQYDDVPEKPFAREQKINGGEGPDGVVRRSRFMGMAANGERPASQWTQGRLASSSLHGIGISTIAIRVGESQGAHVWCDFHVDDDSRCRTAT